MARHKPACTPTSAQTFFSNATKERFDKNINKRVFWSEKGFLFKDESLNYAEEVTLVVRTHGWEVFYLHPDDIYTKMVREFHAHLSTPETTFVYV